MSGPPSVLEMCPEAIALLLAFWFILLSDNVCQFNDFWLTKLFIRILSIKSIKTFQIHLHWIQCELFYLFVGLLNVVTCDIFISKWRTLLCWFRWFFTPQRSCCFLLLSATSMFAKTISIALWRNSAWLKQAHCWDNHWTSRWLRK